MPFGIDSDFLKAEVSASDAELLNMTAIAAFNVSG